jgi:SAM-dependent methyltransferase
MVYRPAMNPKMSGSSLREIAPNLELGPEGWWSSRSVSDVSYPEEGNALCFAVEDSSFWFGHRNRCILEVLKLFPPPGVFFDVGGGNGYVARGIQESGSEVVLVEPGLAGVRNAVNRGIRQVVRATLEDAGVLPGTIPAVGLFDVVEHIQEDHGFLAAIHRLMAPGGRMYITVPAYQALWSNEDKLAGHARRYTIPAMTAVLQKAGYEIEFATYFFGFLPLPVLLFRALPYRLGVASSKMSEEGVRSDHEPNPLGAWVLQSLMRRELAKIAKGRTIRMGGSCLVVARKRDAETSHTG